MSAPPPTSSPPATVTSAPSTGAPPKSLRHPPPNATATTTVAPSATVTFKCLAREDLYLAGTHRSLLRVSRDAVYPVVMQRSQLCKSLFKHYAKYHGLVKEHLLFRFHSEIGGCDSPASLNMRNDDVVYVYNAREGLLPLAHPRREGGTGTVGEGAMGECVRGFERDVKGMWEVNEVRRGRDLGVKVEGGGERGEEFVVDGGGRSSATAGAHHIMFCSRSPAYLAAVRGTTSPYFAVTAPSSSNNMWTLALHQDSVSEHTVQAMGVVLEYVNTGDVKRITQPDALGEETGEGSTSAESAAVVKSAGGDCITAAVFLETLLWARRLGLDGLVRLSEVGAVGAIDDDNVLELLSGISGGDDDKEKMEKIIEQGLGRHCMNYIMSHLKDVCANPMFEKQLQANPGLIVPLLQMAADKMPETKRSSSTEGGGGGSAKKRKLDVV